MADPILLGLMAQTHVHVGIGQATEGVDLPVARERATQWPFIPGSGVKGAFRVWAREQAGLGAEVNALFGREGADTGDDGDDGDAGGLLFSDARLLLLPVRALVKGARWVTSPGLLRRLIRDMERAGQTPGFAAPELARGQFLGADTDKWLGLEEREFEKAGDVAPDLIAALAPITGEDEAWLRERLVILHDDDFVWFARYALPVSARNKLDDNKRVKDGALWYEESLAPETCLYTLVGERKAGTLGKFIPGLERAPHVQMGGNETIGQGWFRIVHDGRERDARS